MSGRIKIVALGMLTVGSLNLPLAFPAQAQGSGLTCGFASVTNATTEGTQTGEVNAGPLLNRDAAGVPTGADITVKCTIQTGVNATHGNADAAVVGPTDPAPVAVLPPTELHYPATDGNVYICTEITVNGSTYYFHVADDTPDPNDVNHWTTNSGAACALAISQEMDLDCICTPVGCECIDGVLDIDPSNLVVRHRLQEIPSSVRDLEAQDVRSRRPACPLSHDAQPPRNDDHADHVAETSGPGLSTTETT